MRDREFKKGEFYFVKVIVDKDGPNDEDEVAVFVGEKLRRWLYIMADDLIEITEERQ